MAFTDQERGELVTAIEAMVGKLDGFVTQHKNGIEVATVFMEVEGSKMDYFFSVIEQSEQPPTADQQRHGHICSRREALCTALLVLASLGIFGVILLVKHLKRSANGK